MLMAVGVQKFVNSKKQSNLSVRISVLKPAHQTSANPIRGMTRPLIIRTNVIVFLFICSFSLCGLFSVSDIVKFKPNIKITNVETHLPTASQDSIINFNLFNTYN